MKQLTCFFLLLTVSFQLLAQNVSPVTDSIRKEGYLKKTNSQNRQPAELKALKADYLAKSKRQRITGWVLTGTGIAVTSVGLMLVMADAVEKATFTLTSMMFGADSPDPHPNDRGAILLSGSALMLSGVTFLIISDKNKNKAYFLSFINEPSQQLRYNTVMNTSVPSLRLCLQF